MQNGTILEFRGAVLQGAEENPSIEAHPKRILTSDPRADSSARTAERCGCSAESGCWEGIGIMNRLGSMVLVVKM